MPVPDLIRESFFGQCVYVASGRRIFQYLEDRPGFQLPDQYRPRPESPPSSRATSAPNTPRRSEAATLVNEEKHAAREKKSSPLGPATVPDAEKQQRLETNFVEPVGRDEATAKDPTIVDWYGSDDPECPMNWSFAKKCFVTFDICFITFAIYIGSAIYAPGTLLVSEYFGVSTVVATLGLTLFVAGYGIGPMFLSPLSEIPQIGRTSVYIVTLAIFVVLQVPLVLTNSFAVLLVLRFLTGFIGSPPVATGGASLADIWAPEDRAVAIGVWGLAAVCGPVIGPLVGGYAAQAKGWRWTIWPLLWISGFALVFLFFFLPETSSQAILYRRAARLRQLTGNSQLKSQGERDGEHMTIRDVAQMTLIRPFVIGFTEPIAFCWNIYIALVYGILYIFIESFQVVFVQRHGFTLGQNGLAFMGLFVGAVLAYIVFVPYTERWLRPRIEQGLDKFIPEDRLPPAMLGSLCLPICLFWFGWTSSADIHWIVPIIGSSFFSIGTFLLFQSGLNYLQDVYPLYVASVLAGNDLFRSMLGAGFPLFSNAFFTNLGVGRACSILGGITILMIPIPFVLHRYGAKIRQRSKYAGFEPKL